MFVFIASIPVLTALTFDEYVHRISASTLGHLTIAASRPFDVLLLDLEECLQVLLLRVL